MGKKLTPFEKLERELIKAEKDSLRACMARAALPLGSSRARTTTAVARWWTLAEYRDKLINQYEAAGGDWSTLRARIAEIEHPHKDAVKLIDYECENCLGMPEHGCYCQAVGAIAPGGPLSSRVSDMTKNRKTSHEL